jgi:hypothetical protein
VSEPRVQPLEYEAKPEGRQPRSLSWAVGCFFIACAVVSSFGSLLAVLLKPTPAMADAPPVMVFCPSPFAAGVVAVLVRVFAAIVGKVRRVRLVSRGTWIALSTGVIVGLAFVVMLYVPEPSPLVGMLVTLVGIPLAAALLIAKRDPLKAGAPAR